MTKKVTGKKVPKNRDLLKCPEMAEKMDVTYIPLSYIFLILSHGPDPLAGLLLDPFFDGPFLAANVSSIMKCLRFIFMIYEISLVVVEECRALILRACCSCPSRHYRIHIVIEVERNETLE